MTDIGYVRSFKDLQLPTTNVHKRIREVELEISNKKLKDIPQLIVLKADYGNAKVRVVTPCQPSWCFRCEKFGHSRKECPLRAPEKEKKRQPVPAVTPAVPVPTTVKDISKPASPTSTVHSSRSKENSRQNSNPVSACQTKST
ncbi:hypothetical protein SNE40_019792 [Patella caerulea]|uniref:CCHC-type domain-containing protein n=1 Tax=Patella caerulea TaxID=87958 RepID=A0AAN8G2K3_PATCE